jgi:hypothetical protein
MVWQDVFQNRFQLLPEFIYLVNNENLATLVRKIIILHQSLQPVLQQVNRMSHHHYYTPDEPPSVDQRLAGMKCHSQVSEYLPIKHHHK